jgi:superoxide dismutase, Fe-Mn family
MLRFLANRLGTCFGLCLLTSPSLAAPFAPPALALPESALSPWIGATSLQLHHGRIHAVLAQDLNTEVARDARLEGVGLEQMLRGISEYDEALRYLAGGHYNHTVFWQQFAPDGAGGEPSEALAQALGERFGSVEAFRRQFENSALSLTGSGWAWLMLDEQGVLQISTTINHDNPVMDTATPVGQPLLALDLWEHAYLLDHGAQRADYVRGFWAFVDWNVVNQRFVQAGGMR